MLIKLEFFDRFSKETEISSSIEIHPVGVELFHADGRTDGHDESNNRFNQFLEGA
jgi:hypothetical protein